MTETVDRFALELLLVEQVCKAGVEDLTALYQQLTGHELTIITEDGWEEITGSSEALTVANKAELKKAMDFLLEVLAEE